MDQDSPIFSLRLMAIGCAVDWDYGFVEAVHHLFNHSNPPEEPAYPGRKTTALTLSPDMTFYLLSQHRHIFFQMDEILQQGFLGMLLIVNSAQSSDFRELQGIVQTLWGHAVFPFRIVVINLESEGAWPLDDLRIVLRVPPDIPMSACLLTDPASLKTVLLDFLAQVLAFGEESAEEESHAS